MEGVTSDPVIISVGGDGDLLVTNMNMMNNI